MPTLTVDSIDSVGEYTSLFPVSGNPAISYYDATNGDLKYVRATTVSGSAWGTPIAVDAVGDVGKHSSLNVVDGYPAISYQDSIANDLKYVRATDATGTAWGTPLTLDSFFSVGEYTSLHIVDGNPAIAYYDFSNGQLLYIRATDATGSTWGSPMVVDAVGDAGPFACLQTVNGRPAISYYANTDDDLKYVRASDTTGGSWGTPLIVDGAVDSVGRWTSLVIVNGNPAIAYRDDTNTQLKYARSADVDGLVWSATIAVDSGANLGQYVDMAVVDGKPAIAYNDLGTSDLKYAAASDINGGMPWNPSVTIDSIGVVGRFNSLKLINGTPAISYCECATDDLKYAYFGLTAHSFATSADIVVPLGGGAQPVDLAVFYYSDAAGTIKVGEETLGTIIGAPATDRKSVV